MPLAGPANSSRIAGPRSPKETHRLNRHGLLVDACLTQADGHAERGGRAEHDRASCRPADSDHAWRRQSLHAEDFVNELRSTNVTPHLAQNTSGRSSAIDG
ncbi:hypothetical protein ACVWXO_000692 [Bradyrhizobium sp. LM2.7]